MTDTAEVHWHQMDNETCRFVCHQNMRVDGDNCLVAWLADL